MDSGNHHIIFGTAICNSANLVKINKLICLVIDHSSSSKIYLAI